MTKYWYPPLFFTQNFFTKMTQNGLKWILNITFKTVKFFFFNEGFPYPLPLHSTFKVLV